MHPGTTSRTFITPPCLLKPVCACVRACAHAPEPCTSDYKYNANCEILTFVERRCRISAYRSSYYAVVEVQARLDGYQTCFEGRILALFGESGGVQALGPIVSRQQSGLQRTILCSIPYYFFTPPPHAAHVPTATCSDSSSSSFSKPAFGSLQFVAHRRKDEAERLGVSCVRWATSCRRCGEGLLTRI